MRDMASPSPVHFSVQQPSPNPEKKTSRTSLVNSFGSTQRSYGTVKESASGIGSPYRSSEYFNHPVCEEDTLQGIALQYDVSVSAFVCPLYMWPYKFTSCDYQLQNYL